MPSCIVQRCVFNMDPGRTSGRLRVLQYIRENAFHGRLHGRRKECIVGGRERERKERKRGREKEERKRRTENGEWVGLRRKERDILAAILENTRVPAGDLNFSRTGIFLFGFFALLKDGPRFCKADPAGRTGSDEARSFLRLADFPYFSATREK